jgi:hypothetical protein
MKDLKKYDVIVGGTGVYIDLSSNFNRTGGIETIVKDVEGVSPVTIFRWEDKTICFVYCKELDNLTFFKEINEKTRLPQMSHELFTIIPNLKI